MGRVVGILDDIQKRNAALKEAAGDGIKKKAKKKEKKKRTHVNQFTAKELGALSLAEFTKLDQS